MAAGNRSRRQQFVRCDYYRQRGALLIVFTHVTQPRTRIAIMYRQRTGARFEHREQESQRVKDSPSLADRFRKLKSLTVDLSFYDPEGVSKTSQVKYTVNITNAKSVFRFNCPNTECIRGDFDLTDQLATAVAKRKTMVTGEMVCQGWRSKTTVDTVRCANILRYKLTLGY
jgi:hypothetical protein